MHWSSIQIILIVATYVRNMSRLKWRRKFRIGITGFLVPAKSRMTENWKRLYPTPTLACGKSYCVTLCYVLLHASMEDRFWHVPAFCFQLNSLYINIRAYVNFWKYSHYSTLHEIRRTYFLQNIYGCFFKVWKFIFQNID
jgi:hypothetical protein